MESENFTSEKASQHKSFKRNRLRWAPAKIVLVSAAALLIATGCSLSPSTLPTVNATPTKKPTVAAQLGRTQDDTLLQCANISYSPESDLFIDPMTMINGPKNPQIQHAINTLYGNKIYDLQAIDLLPQGTKLRFLTLDPQISNFCLPDKVIGQSRFFIQTGTGSGLNLPAGTKGNNLVEFQLPTGLNPIVLKRLGQRFPRGPKEVEEWLFFNLQKNQKIGFKNSNGSAFNIGKGPLALQSAGPALRYIDFVQPERGFADDKPIPNPNQLK